MAGPVKWIALLMATPAYSSSERAVDSVSSARLKEPFSHDLLCGNFLFRNIGRYPSSAAAPQRPPWPSFRNKNLPDPALRPRVVWRADLV